MHQILGLEGSLGAVVRWRLRLPHKSWLCRPLANSAFSDNILNWWLPLKLPYESIYFGIQLLNHFSCVRLCATPQTAAHQAPPSLGFSKQEHWSGLTFPSPGNWQQTSAKSMFLISCLLPSSKSHIYWPPPTPTCLEQSLRAIWNAVFWAIVLIVP